MRRALGVFLAFAVLPGPALAAEPEDAELCRGEAERRCAAVEDAGARKRCIVEREMECELEGPRRPTRDGAAPRSFRGACRADFEKLCGRVGRNASRKDIVACLSAHRVYLSDECRAAIDEGS